MDRPAEGPSAGADIDAIPEDEISQITQADTEAWLYALDWRIEFTGRGQFYQFRKGSGKNRRSHYGGKVSDLVKRLPERVKAYEHNKTRKARRRVTVGDQSSVAERRPG